MTTQAIARPVERAREILVDVLRKPYLSLHKSTNKHALAKDLVRNCRLWYEDNFTVALVNNKFIGVAKRNPTDRFNYLSGESFAISRAIKKLVELTFQENAKS